MDGGDLALEVHFDGGGARIQSCSEDQREQLHGDPDLTRRVTLVRSTIPAVTHVDYSARLQTVDAQIQQVTRVLRITDDVMRHMVVRRTGRSHGKQAEDQAPVS
jgi:hypothetical protein